MLPPVFDVTPFYGIVAKKYGTIKYQIILAKMQRELVGTAVIVIAEDSIYFSLMLCKSRKGGIINQSILLDTS